MGPHCSRCDTALTALKTYRFEGAAMCYDCWYRAATLSRLQTELQGIREAFEPLDDHTFRIVTHNSWVGFSRMMFGIVLLVQLVLLANVGAGLVVAIFAVGMLPLTFLSGRAALRARNTTQRFVLDVKTRMIDMEHELRGARMQERVSFDELNLFGGCRGGGADGTRKEWLVSLHLIWYSLFSLTAVDAEDVRIKMAALALFLSPESEEYLTRFVLADEPLRNSFYSFARGAFVDHCVAEEAARKRMEAQRQAAPCE